MSNEKEQKPSITVAEAGRRGGAKVSKLYGKEFFEKIGNKGGQTTKERYGPEFYEAIGKMGGTKTAKMHGPEFYQSIGKKGGERVREMIAKAKEIEAKELGENQNDG